MKTVSYAYDPPADSRLAVASRHLAGNLKTDKSGFIKLFRNDDAMHWRILLVDMAEESLDIQYFIWKGDACGELLLDDEGRLFWKSGDTILRKEPARSSWHRFQAWFFGLFDLDDQL